ncbi:hypothetical protein LSH36_36g04039 [Paralvinella palmiformis]|uniref:3-oxoacyl-[acyl-carrier-protein] reductase n=1 Tax=Paralvinella palmiformis TaxID=53620 RepID=A0AAD9NGX1_9ANNE|nr:hypothetical protein LSH36_36g04039 [Paralvinella palmiformis]
MVLLAMERYVALVTGSTSGIGLGIARRLASRGDDVILTGLGDDALITSLVEEFSSLYKGKTRHIFADLTKPEDIEKMCREIKQFYPNGVDIIVNNAGFQHVSPVEEFPTEKWDAMLSVMLSAPFHFIKNLLPDMKHKDIRSFVETKCSKNTTMGHIMVVALETAGTGITCNAICPGYVNTPSKCAWACAIILMLMLMVCLPLTRHHNQRKV